MTKEEYKQKKQELLSAIDLLDKQYIEANQPCNIGDIVADKYGNKGMVTKFKIGWNDCIEPIVAKINKDGSVSVKQLYIGYGYTVLSKNTNT